MVRQASATGLIFVGPAESRQAAHPIVRAVYERHHERPRTPIAPREAAKALTDAFLNVNWHDVHGRNAAGRESGEADAFFGGGGFREQFTNMRCVDEMKSQLTAWRTLAEVGWTGGGMIGYPLLVAGHRLDDVTAIERGRYMLDQVANAYNEDSGLLWDVCGKHEGKRLNWWWSGYIVQDCHCAYTNGTGVYHLLKAYRYARDAMGQSHDAWRDTAERVLATIVKLQKSDGNLGYTYSPTEPRILDDQGFAGVWFAAALAMAYQLTTDDACRAAADRALDYYGAFVDALDCWGAPMDTWKSNDQEGNLGFLRAAMLMHQATGESKYLEMLERSALYEYLWRVGFSARPQHPPLKGSHFSSVGGSITSVSNPHIHPMGVYISRELLYIAEQTGSEYHRQRAQDGIDWGVNIVSLYPEVATYGQRGVLTERFCPSDGLTVETFPDGSPSSLWFSYNGWAAAAVLEGLVETLD